MAPKRMGLEWIKNNSKRKKFPTFNSVDTKYYRWRGVLLRIKNACVYYEGLNALKSTRYPIHDVELYNQYVDPFQAKEATIGKLYVEEWVSDIILNGDKTYGLEFWAPFNSSLDKLYRGQKTSMRELYVNSASKMRIKNDKIEVPHKTDWWIRPMIYKRIVYEEAMLYFL